MISGSPGDIRLLEDRFSSPDRGKFRNSLEMQYVGQVALAAVQISADGCGSDADEADPSGSNSDSDFDSWRSSLRSQRSTQFKAEAGERFDTVLTAEADGCSEGFQEAGYFPGDGSANPGSSDSDSGSDSDSDFDIGAEQLRECEAAYSYMQLQQAELDQLRQNADLSGSDLSSMAIPGSLAILVSLAIQGSILTRSWTS